MPIPTVILIILGSAAFVIFGLAALSVLNALINCTQPVKLTAAKSDAVSWPEAHRATNERMYALGFRELGTAGARRNPGEKFDYMQVYVSDNDWIAAKVGYGRSLKAWALFQTYFENDALLLTRFSVGKQIDDTNLHIHRVTDSIEAAYEYHVQQLAIRKEMWGEPQEIRTLKDVLQQHEIYNAKYHRQEMQWAESILRVVLVRNILISFAGIGWAIVAYQDLSLVVWAVMGCVLLLAIALSSRISQQQRAEREALGLPQPVSSRSEINGRTASS